VKFFRLHGRFGRRFFSFQPSFGSPRPNPYVGIGLVAPLLLSGWGDFAVRPSSNLQLGSKHPLVGFREKPSLKMIAFGSIHNFPIRFNTGSQTTYMPVPSNAACVWRLKIPAGYNPLHLQNFADIQSLPLPVFSKLTALQRLFFLKKQGGDIPGYALASENPIALYESIEPRPLAYAPSHWSIEEDSQKKLASIEQPFL
jgi:hypothetical protein